MTSPSVAAVILLRCSLINVVRHALWGLYLGYITASIQQTSVQMVIVTIVQPEPPYEWTTSRSIYFPCILCHASHMMTNIANAKKTLLWEFSTAVQIKHAEASLFLTFERRKWLYS